MNIFDLLTLFEQYFPVTPAPELEGAVAQGILAAIIFTLGTLLIYIVPRWKWTLASILLIGITPLAIGGFWFSPNHLGISDWDYYFSLHNGHRTTLLTYHQLPHWNPYTCGGTAGIADPEFRFFTPTFLAQLVFGIPEGFRIAIFIATATGALGMLALGKRLGLSVYASLIAAIGVAFSSVNLLEIVEGHPNIFSAMWIPWIFWSWLAAYTYVQKQELSRYLQWINPWSMLCGIFLTLTFFQGGIYLLMYTAIAFGGLLFLTHSWKKSFFTSLQAGLWSLGFSAIKIIPVMLWLEQFQDKAYASSTFTLPYIHKILFGRYIHTVDEIIPKQGSGWHEYGAYIGITIGVLAIIGIIKNYKRRIPQALLITAVAAVLISSLGPYLKPIFDQASFLPRSNISRFILFGIIPIALLAGYGTDTILTLQWSKQKWFSVVRVVVVFICVLFASTELMSLTYPLSLQAFVLPHTETPPMPAPKPIAYTAFTYEVRHNGVDYTRAYEAASRGYGTLFYCSVLSPEPSVRTIHDEEDNGIISIHAKDDQKGSYELLSWTPNKVHVKITTPTNADVILNANYAKGWTVNQKPAKEISGRVATKVTVGTHELTFSFFTPGFITGTFISLTSIISAATILILIKKKKS